MKTFSLEVSNDVFAQHSWYFRNALVRANYNDLKNGVHATTKFLEKFFSNMLMGTNYELKNRYMHVDYRAEIENNELQSATLYHSKCQTGTLNVTLEELALLKEIINEPAITQTMLAARTGKSVRTIKREMTVLKEKGYIRRLNGKRNGKWEVLIEVLSSP